MAEHLTDDAFSPSPATDSADSAVEVGADADRLRRRSSFDAAATSYATARPDYPNPLFDDLVTLAHLPPDGRILEVGPGTGRATLPLARRGYTLVGVELGTQLAAVARTALAPYPNARIEVADFEQWPLPPTLAGQCDLAISASAWHWIDPAIGYPKAAAALTPTGALALLWASRERRRAVLPTSDDKDNSDEARALSQLATGAPQEPLRARDRGAVDDTEQTEETAETAAFDAAVRAITRQIAPQLLGARQPNHRTRQGPDGDGRGRFTRAEEVTTVGSAWFAPPVTRTYSWTVHYAAAHYTQLLDSYSSYRLLDPDVRDRLFAALRTCIDHQFGGQVTRQWRADLYVAQRR